jgi:hypothetical protein
MITAICPYCGIAQANSDDHIIPQFLGGDTTIRVCKTCNDRFGHDFEAAVSDKLARITVVLAICGLKPTKRIVWKKAYTDPDTGWEYDLNPNGELSLSRPYLERDAEGRISLLHIPNDEHLAQKYVASLKKKGLAEEVEQRIVRENIKSLHLHFPIGEELRRLAVKMCVGTSHLTLADGKHDVLASTTRAYLMNGESVLLRNIPVKTAFWTYGALDKLRPPLSHVVYVEGDSVVQRCYGVVQFYGAIQLYVILDAHYSGKDFARIGFVNPCLGTECFDVTKPLNLSEAPDILPRKVEEDGKLGWLRKLDDEVRALFGKNMLLFVGPNS